MDQQQSQWFDVVSCYAHTLLPLEGHHQSAQPRRPISDQVFHTWSRLPVQQPDIRALLEQGKRITWLSDVHFHHANIIRFCNRPFRDVHHMDNVLAHAIRSDLESTDVQICLGDWYVYADAKRHQERLTFVQPHQDKHWLVAGNHDIPKKTDDDLSFFGSQTTSVMAFTLDKQWVREQFDTYWPVNHVCFIDWLSLPNTWHVGVSHWPIPVNLLPDPSWIFLHGHIHDKPSVPCGINVSMEAIDYKPRTLVELLTPQWIAQWQQQTQGIRCTSKTSRQPMG